MSTDQFQPSLAYGGTSGWSGSDTSQTRAATNDTNGRTAGIQARVLRMATLAGSHGITVMDVKNATGEHHGNASSALSNLHKDKRLARLSERRDRCKVYVLPDYVFGRETEQQGRVTA